MVTIYAIVFDTSTKELRRVIAMDHEGHSDAELGNYRPGTLMHGPALVGVQPVLAGEMLLIAEAGYNDERPWWENNVFNATGVVPP